VRLKHLKNNIFLALKCRSQPSGSSRYVKQNTEPHCLLNNWNTFEWCYYGPFCRLFNLTPFWNSDLRFQGKPWTILHQLKFVAKNVPKRVQDWVLAGRSMFHASTNCVCVCVCVCACWQHLTERSVLGEIHTRQCRRVITLVDFVEYLKLFKAREWKGSSCQVRWNVSASIQCRAKAEVSCIDFQEVRSPLLGMQWADHAWTWQGRDRQDRGSGQEFPCHLLQMRGTISRACRA